MRKSGRNHLWSGLSAFSLLATVLLWASIVNAATVTLNPEDTTIYQGTDLTQADSNIKE